MLPSAQCSDVGGVWGGGVADLPYAATRLAARARLLGPAPLNGACLDDLEIAAGVEHSSRREPGRA